MRQRTYISDHYHFGNETAKEPSELEKDRQLEKEDTEKSGFWHFTLYEILTILCAAAIPIAVGIYTGVQSEQNQRQADRTRQFDLQQAEELRQQSVYDQFLDNIYNLDKDGYLKDEQIPWAFANAYFRAAHRQWDALRKADVLKFLVEKRLLRTEMMTKNNLPRTNVSIIRLNELDFDHVYLTSQTNSLNQLDLQYISFDQVSMIKARFSFVNLNGSSFIRARLNQAKFDDSSLAYATFDTTQLHQTDFGNSDLTGALFFNVDLSTAKLTRDQLQQAVCVNTTLPNGTICSGILTSTTTGSSTMMTTTMTMAAPTSLTAFPTVPSNPTEPTPNSSPSDSTNVEESFSHALPLSVSNTTTTHLQSTIVTTETTSDTSLNTTTTSATTTVVSDSNTTEKITATSEEPHTLPTSPTGP